MYKNGFLFLAITLLAGCVQGPANNETAADKTLVIPVDTVPQVRTVIRNEPVASYTEKVDNDLNDWKFAVSVYETQHTFQYLLRIRYKELRVTDSIVVPDLGRMPEIVLKKGANPLSCIIGFMDKQKQIKEYKLISIKEDQLKISTLNNYHVRAYRTPVSKK